VLAVFPRDVHSRAFTRCVQPLHMHRGIIISHNLVTEIKKKVAPSKIDKQIAFHWDMTLKITVSQCIALQMQEPSPCLRPNPKSICSLAGGYWQGYQLTGWIGFAFSKGDVLHSPAGSTPGMLAFDCSFIEPSLIWLLPGQDFPHGICEIPGTMSRHSITSPNVVGAGAAASSSVWGRTPAGTLYLDVPYCLSRVQK